MEKTFTPFEIRLRTDVRFGPGVEKKAGEMIQMYGGSKVLFLYGGGSIKKTGLYDTITASLKEAGLSFIECGGVQPNPRRSLVEKAADLAKKEGVDFILAVGGGSVIDSAKAIGLALEDEGNYWEFFQKKRFPQKMTPVGCIHTLSATGSEMSVYAVIKDDVDTGLKYGCNGFANQTTFALMDPELTYSVPAYQTAAGAADIFSHTFERYFVRSSCNLSDEFALGLLRTVVKYARKAIEQPSDYEARAELMLAGAYSHNGITGIGRSGMPFTAHGIEQSITALYDTAHGATLSVIMPAELQFIIEHGDDSAIEKVAQMGVEVFGVKPDYLDMKGVAREGCLRFKNWLKSIGMPITLSELGVPESDIPHLASLAQYGENGKLNGYMALTPDDVLSLLMSCK